MDFWEQFKVAVPEGECGRWRVERFTVGEREFSQVISAMKYGRSVPGGTYTALKRGGKTIMSDTPDEIRDFLGFTRRARGRVLVHGLGLGVLLKALLAKESITAVDVVEASAEVLELVGPTYAADPRVSLHHGDAYTFQFPAGVRWDCAWHDIWDDICTENLEGIGRLHRRYGRRVEWQDSWVRDLLVSRRRREKREEWAWR